MPILLWDRVKINELGRGLYHCSAYDSHPLNSTGTVQSHHSSGTLVKVFWDNATIGIYPINCVTKISTRI